MADIIDYKIYGDDLQLIEIELDPREGVRAEAGTMTYMEGDIQMQTSTGGGLFQGFKRMLTGAGFFITTFVNAGNRKARVAFAAPYPGKVIPLDLGQLGGKFGGWRSVASRHRLFSSFCPHSRLRHSICWRV